MPLLPKVLMVRQHLPAILPLALLRLGRVLLDYLEYVAKDYFDIFILVRAILNVQVRTAVLLLLATMTLIISPLQYLLEQPLNMLFLLVFLHFCDAYAGWLLLRRHE